MRAEHEGLSVMPTRDVTDQPVPLVMSGVLKRFGQQTVIDGLNLQLDPGKIVALLGPNGAGKSTTLALAMGFIAPECGTITVAGVDVIAQPRQARPLIGYIPEQVRLYPSLTGLENLAYFTALAGILVKRQTLSDTLLRLGIDVQAQQRRSAFYSKGMCQKVAIAIAQTKASRLLLLDEPTSGLDPQAALDLNRILAQAAATGTAILMATHDLLRAREIADRVIVMQAGRLIHDQSLASSDADLESIYLSAFHSPAPCTR